nr:FKBP-type peptidyl-prolyl cis-trans isomerase [uncultured Carboxylicivirga sp.]
MDFSFLNRITITGIVLLGLSFSSCNNGKKEKKVVVTREMLIEHNRKLLNLEAEVIKKYLDENNIQMQQTSTGLWYRIISDSVGPMITENQMVFLDYQVSLLDGTICYSAKKDGLWKIIVGKTEIETAVHEACLLASVGDSIQFIAPPHLAYGVAGDGNRVPSQSILLYNVKVLKVDKLP